MTPSADELEAANLLLSVSPTCHPIQRPRSLSLDALCDAALLGHSVLSSNTPPIYSLRKIQEKEESLSILQSLRRMQQEENFAPNKRMKKSTSEHPDSFKVGVYSPEERRERIARFVMKRNARIWTKKVRYSCRKNLAQCRTRLKGRFVSSKKLMDETMSTENLVAL